ncbi:OLC1v1004948C3 [Oldenlandia corymbosa var. corymbosa]|uniref:OLC1v1004948C3 n=1 Tax=Oldenlandia corymbosa var. corymbosa TaxID=529605 RepID=A0AAV1DFX1_OLDCO|nr:OLC1v1004948C3 [Oldenlandia corymbosa var. corymbosa]
MLSSVLAKFAQRLSKYDVPFELTHAQKFYVEYSHSDNDNYSYFDVSLRDETMDNTETLEDNVQHQETDNTAQIILGIGNDKEMPSCAHLGGGKDQQPASFGQQPSMEITSVYQNSQDRAEALIEVSTDADGLIISDAAEDSQFQVAVERDNQPPALDQQPPAEDGVRPNANEAAQTSAGLVFLTGRNEISLAIIQQYEGSKLADVETELGREISEIL